MEVKKYDTWFELIGCAIGVTSELENTIMYIKPLWLFIARSLTTWPLQIIRNTSYTGVFSLANYSWRVCYLHASKIVCLEKKVSYLAFHIAWNNGIPALHGIVHFTVACLVPKPFCRSEACCFSKVNCLVVMLTRYWSLLQQGYFQPHSKSKAWHLSTQL